VERRRLIGPQNEYPAADWPTREAISKRYLDGMLMRLWWVRKRSRSTREGSQSSSRTTASPPMSSPTTTTHRMKSTSGEARRLVGRYIFKEQDNVVAEGIARTPIHSDSIGMTDWPVDSVACLPRKTPGGNTDGILFLGEESRPAQVPYRSILANEVETSSSPSPSAPPTSAGAVSAWNPCGCSSAKAPDLQPRWP